MTRKKGTDINGSTSRQLDPHHPPPWVPREKTANFATPDLSHATTLEFITDTIEAIKYTGNQAPHDSRFAQGLFAVDEDAIALAGEVRL